MADTRSRQLPTCTTAPNWIGESSEDSPTRGASVVVAARDSEVVAVVSVGVAGAASPNVARGASVVVAARDSEVVAVVSVGVAGDSSGSSSAAASSRTVSLSSSPLVSVRAVMTISTIRIPPVIRTQRRRQNGGLSDPSPPSSSTGGLEGVCGGGGGGIEGLAVCAGAKSWPHLRQVVRPQCPSRNLFQRGFESSPWCCC